MKNFNKNQVIEILKTCLDPELPIDLWNLGLIYNIEIGETENGKSDLNIKMSLTTPGCTMGNQMAENIKKKITDNIIGVGNINVIITFDPEWEPSMMTGYAREKLGLPKRNNKKLSKQNDNWE
tara:strand:- start:176 stop:544 length:369 start_codon:yes stop_codon:yes gene_type:complete